MKILPLLLQTADISPLITLVTVLIPLFILIAIVKFIVNTFEAQGRRRGRR